MNKIYFATTNSGKVSSLNSALKQYDIVAEQVDIELPEPRSDNIREIARAKVGYAYEKIGKPCVALDAGFYIDSLNGFPKTFVNSALDTIGIEGILKLVEDKERTCEFRECLAFKDYEMDGPLYFESSTRGTLATEPRGERKDKRWSDLHLVFIPEGREKTIAEMTDEEHDFWRSERGENHFSKRFAKWVHDQRKYDTR